MAAPVSCVAYCFLFRSEPLCWEQWWRDFLQNCAPGRIVIHSKRAVTSAFAGQFALPREKTVRTAWAHSSLVEASIVLFREALLRELSPSGLFCLLSESCIPLGGRESVEQELWDLTLQGSVSLLPTTGAGPIPHEQWCVLTRDAALALVRGHLPLLITGSPFGCMDEVYIGLAVELEGLPWRRAQTTHALREKGESHPKAYLQQELPALIRLQRWVFLRKVQLDAPPPPWWRALVRGAPGLSPQKWRAGPERPRP